jgi:hypothetical protein
MPTMREPDTEESKEESRTDSKEAEPTEERGTHSKSGI